MHHSADNKIVDEMAGGDFLALLESPVWLGEKTDRMDAQSAADWQDDWLGPGAQMGRTSATRLAGPEEQNCWESAGRLDGILPKIGHHNFSGFAQNN
jgi:hypothetical protein